MSEIKPKKERRFLKTLGRVGEILVEQVLLKLGSSIIKKIGGKKPLPSILFIFLSLSLFAQYPNTLNKQRLGFQTTGDGLTWRGSISDTASIQPINNQNAWVILDTINLKFYSFDFTSNVWNLVGGGSAAFTQPVDSLFFNVNVPTNNVDTAKMRWDSDLATVVLGLNDNVPNELGFKNFWLVKNQTGSTITKGSIVYANGTVGASGRITVAKFIANGSIDAKYLLGITAHDLTDGEDGYVISFGKIRQVNTDTFAEGAILYPSPTVAGVWTDIEPIAPNIDMPIGFCINSHVNNGTIAIRVASGYKLSELHDVAISSPIENSSLYYKSGLWRDTTAALLVSDTASMLLPYLRDADTATLSNRINLKLNISDTSAFARDNQISGTSGQVAYFNGSNSVTSNADLIYNAASNTLGINTTTTTGANLIIKNSQEPSRATVVTTQSFAADTTNWTRSTGWTFNGTQAVATAATGDLTYTSSPTITGGNAYEITYTVANYTSGTLTAKIGDGLYNLPLVNTTNNIIIITPTLATGGFRFSTSSFTGNLDNVSVVEITGSAPVIFAGQDDAAVTLYNSLRMPNSTTLAFGGGGGRTTGLSNTFIGTNTGLVNTIGANNNFIGNNAGSSNTRGSGNTFIGNNAGLRNVNGISNNFMGENSGRDNVNGNLNVFIGPSAGQSNISGSSNMFFGDLSGYLNTIGSNNNFFGVNSGRSNTTGSSNVAIGNSALYNITAGDTLTGSNNIAIGTNAGDNIEFAAANNLIIGNGIDLPIDGGSHQLVIKNIIFATGTSGTGTTIAASSKAGIKTATPNRDLEVAGEVRITDLTTDAPTRLVGADADGDLGQVTLGSTLSLTGSSLGVTSNTFLPLTGGTLTGGLTVATSGVPFTVNSTNSNTNKITLSDNGTIRSYLGANDTKLFTVANASTTEFMFIDNNGVNRINASGVPIQINSTNSNINKIGFYDGGTNTGYIASNSLNPFIVNNRGDTTVASISHAGNASFAGNITEAGNNVLTNLDTVSLSNRINLKFNTADTSQLNLTSRFSEKQNTLVSTVNIKTLNGNNLLGSGNLSLTTGNTFANGTLNYIPVFSSSTDIINSPIFRNTLNNQLRFESYGLSSDKRVSTSEYFTEPITISTTCGSAGAPNIIGISTGNYVNNCSSGTAFLLLPDPSNTTTFTTGRTITITNLRSTQSITLNTSGSYSNARPLGMDAVAETSIAAKRWITVQSNGTNWYIIATGSAL